MVSSKICMFVGIPLGGRSNYRVRSSKEEKFESIIVK